jgi:peptidoglycan/LPS O-acetylase OafA/YrhL
MTRSAGRLRQIDGLRALAALSVVAFHYTTRYDTLFGHVAPPAIALPVGYLGVDLFFGISGFVILMSLQHIERPGEFVVSRFARLFPTYWAAVLLTWVVIKLAGGPGHVPTVGEGLLNLSMVHTFFGVTDVDGVYWSLQVELIYYMLMLALWCQGALRRPERVLLAWTGAALAAAVAVDLHLPVPWVLRMFLLLDWVPWFALGMVVYLNSRDSLWGAARILIVALSMAAILARTGPLTLCAAAATPLLLLGAARQRLTWLATRPLLFVGAISYPLYLVHERIGWTAIKHIEAAGAGPGLAIAGACACCFALASLLHWGIEERARATLRARLAAGMRRGAPAGTGARRWATATVMVLLAGFAVAASSSAREAARREKARLNSAVGVSDRSESVRR